MIVHVQETSLKSMRYLKKEFNCHRKKQHGNFDKYYNIMIKIGFSASFDDFKSQISNKLYVDSLENRLQVHKCCLSFWFFFLPKFVGIWFAINAIEWKMDQSHERCKKARLETDKTNQNWNLTNMYERQVHSAVHMGMKNAHHTLASIHHVALNMIRSMYATHGMRTELTRGQFLLNQ